MPDDGNVDASPPPLRAYASWEVVTKVAPVPAVVEAPSPADIARARERAVVHTGDLRLASGVVIAGPCWDVAKHRAAEAGLLDPEMPNELGKNLNFDLDGDGKPDAVIDGGARIRFTTYWLYVMRDSCGYYVGSVETAGVLRATPQMAKGLRQLESAWGCRDHPGAGPQHARWSFDAARYVRSKRWTDGNQKPCNDPENF